MTPGSRTQGTRRSQVVMHLLYGDGVRSRIDTDHSREARCGTAPPRSNGAGAPGTLRYYGRVHAIRLPLSSLQGRAMAAAFDELAALELASSSRPQSIRLPASRRMSPPPGRHPPTMDSHSTPAVVRLAGRSLRGPMPSRCIRPRSGAPWRAWTRCRPRHRSRDHVPPAASSGRGEIKDAMAAALPLAVDISHVYIQRAQGAMSERTWHRPAGLSTHRPRCTSRRTTPRDSHQPLAATASAWRGLASARHRRSRGVRMLFASTV